MWPSMCNTITNIPVNFKRVFVENIVCIRVPWQVSGAITFLRTENMFYAACPNKLPEGRQCNKKLTDNGDGTW